MSAATRRKRSYVKLAAFLAAQPPTVERLSLTLREVEEAIGESLPRGARFPYWWENRDDRLHSRAWLTAGWEVSEMDRYGRVVTFRRVGSTAGG